MMIIDIDRPSVSSPIKSKKKLKINYKIIEINL
jgi:hypothetical protein